jgi:hypothetical protein
MLERKRERLLEKQTRDETEVARITAELDDLEAKRKNLRAAMEERSKQIGTVEEELAELVKKALAEGDAAGAAGRSEEDGAAPWSAQAAATALQSMATRPGMPPEFAAVLAHVVQAAQAIARASTPTTTTTGTHSAEGGESRSHRGSQQQQQQQPHQQGQPHQPMPAADPGTSQRTGAGNAAADTGGKGSLSGAAAATLAPQGRWNKAAGSSAGNNGGRDDGDDMQIDATGPIGNQATEGGAGNPEEDEQELREEEPLAAHIDEGVAESINKLPVADQEKLKAALGARGGRRRPTDEEQGRGAGGDRDRERSPRPTKGGHGQQEQ